MNRQYSKAYKAGDTDIPKPSKDDYSEALVKIFNKKIDRKTIGYIINAGEVGLLN